MSETAIAAIARKVGGDGDREGVWPDNVAAVEAFLLVASQWRTVMRETVAGIRIHYMGLDYGAAHAGLALAGVAVDPRTWWRVRVIEAAAREALNGMAG
jgi:hypothetical protein